MSTILGVHDGHDSGAALIDGSDIYAVNEERLGREKYKRGFPRNSVKKVIELGGIKAKNIDRIAVAGIYRKKKKLLTLKDRLKDVIGDISGNILTVEHHLAHAAGAYFTSGWKDTVVLTVDAAGDGLSSAVYVGEDEELKKIAESSYLESLGDFYASITEMLGFRPMRDEGKVMALSSYGEETDRKAFDFSECIEVDGLGFKNHLKVTGSESMKELADKVDFPLQRRDECSDILKKNRLRHELGEKAVRSAASAQTHLEDLLLEFTQNIRESDLVEQRDRIAYAGGVAQNVKGNATLRENFDYHWIFPHMGDGGLALGAALYLNSKIGARKKMWDWKGKVNNVYLGPEYSDKEIKSALSAAEQMRYEPIEGNKYDKIAELLAKGKMIGIFQGRMEYGPRALGNRSIVADPSDEKVRDVLNKKLGREPFQPFSPTILEEYKETYLKEPDHNSFMTMSFDATEKAAEDIRAAVHVDGTTRPQIIREEENPDFYKMIKRFEEEKGIGAVLNTSFNIHGEPIVCTPEEALDTFKKAGLGVLLLEDYKVCREV